MTMVEAMSHREAVELLPWLANDSLQSAERERVMQHAQSCVVCRRELEELMRIRDTIEAASDLASVPEPDMRNINARIDALIEKQTRGRRIADGIREFFGEPWRLAFAIQTVLLLALGTVLFWPVTDQTEFTTLTTDVRELPGGHFVRIVLDPDVARSDADRLLKELDLVVIDGPSNRSVYTLGFANPVSIEERDSVIEQLAEKPVVLFAQPVTGGAKP